jgi:hypothetical protein
MKKLLLILLCLPMIYSSCQEDDPVPAANPPPPPTCCAFSGTVNATTTLTHNPSNGIMDMCIPASVATNQNGDIVDIMLQFYSLCSNGYNWTMTVELNATVNDSIIQNNQTYNLGTPSTNYLIGNVIFNDYNCSWMPISTHSTAADQSGTVMFDVDWVNNEIGGAFTLTGEDASGVLPPKTVICTFSGLPF